MAKNQKWSIEYTDQYVRTLFGGDVIAESVRPVLLRESRYELVYYFPIEDVRMENLVKSEQTKRSGYKGTAHFYHIKAGDHVAENAAWMYPDEHENRPDLRDMIAFDWKAMDAWFIEDEEVFGHPRDPYHRVDVYPSSRHVKVVIDGTTVADTVQPLMLYETGLKTRYYIPQRDVNFDLLTSTDYQTYCPYKGAASYWSVAINGNTYENVMWTYPDPLPEQPRIKDLVAFWPDKSDAIEIYVDGQRVT